MLPPLNTSCLVVISYVDARAEAVNREPVDMELDSLDAAILWVASHEASQGRSSPSSA